MYFIAVHGFNDISKWLLFCVVSLLHFYEKVGSIIIVIVSHKIVVHSARFQDVGNQFFMPLKLSCNPPQEGLNTHMAAATALEKLTRIWVTISFQHWSLFLSHPRCLWAHCAFWAVRESTLQMLRGTLFFGMTSSIFHGGCIALARPYHTVSTEGSC